MQSTGHALYIDKHVLYATELWDYTRDSHHTTTITLKMTHMYIQVADTVHTQWTPQHMRPQTGSKPV